MNNQHWTAAAEACHKAGTPYILCTVMGVSGSTPREPGTKMVVTAEDSYGTIGGGQLEFSVVYKARQLLLKPEEPQQIVAFPLARSGQCCGGSVSVLMEYQAGSDWHIAVYGAGHVGHALAKILADLPCRVQWFDSRADLFPDECSSNTNIISVDDLVATIEGLAPNTEVVILTHDHVLDFELCAKSLKHGLSLGMIGSQTKAARFNKRLKAMRFTDQQLANFRSPIGLSEVQGKQPMEVAVSIAGELIQRYYARRQAPKTTAKRGLPWKDIKAVLAE